MSSTSASKYVPSSSSALLKAVSASLRAYGVFSPWSWISYPRNRYNWAANGLAANRASTWTSSSSHFFALSRRCNAAYVILSPQTSHCFFSMLLTTHPRHCRRRGIASFLDQLTPFLKSFFAVKIQDSGGHLIDCSQRVDERAMQGKMVCPVISAWVKEPHQLTGRLIYRHEITPFISVARLAGVGEILSFCGATMLDADDMIHFAAK